jgi:DeoR family glycerol-3-phosphate regulon repressor
MADKTSHRELELLDAMRRAGGFARNSELALALDVSEETVRRTIKALSKAGSVARVHGGAYIVGARSDPSFYRRIAQHADEKRAIAQTIAQSVSDGMTIFLDVASTTAFVAEELRVRHHLTVATNSVGVAQVLVGHNNNRVFLLGGEMHSDERGAFGFVTEQQARRYCYDISVLGADALNPKLGFLYSNPAEADLAAVVSDCSALTLVAMDHTKFNQTAPHRGFEPGSVDRLVSDAFPDAKLAKKLNAWGVRVDACEEERPHVAAQ